MVFCVLAQIVDLSSSSSVSGIGELKLLDVSSDFSSCLTLTMIDHQNQIYKSKV